MKLSAAQERALRILEHYNGEWACAYELIVDLQTLDALVRRGLAERRSVGALSAFLLPRTAIEYRIALGRTP